MTPPISVIIPCYNQGLFLLEALDSLSKLDTSLFEVIIVNDGSTDAETLEILKELMTQGCHIIMQKNKGLGAARNAAVAVAKGEFVLPLDCDNKLRSEYFLKGRQILEENSEVAVVYSDAQYFGSKSGVWTPGDFNMQRLMISNYIDACALIRKSVLVEVGGYDQAMEFMGWEDWDLWLRIAFNGHHFYYLRTVAFDYRYLENSMGKSLYKNYERPNKLENYVNEKYKDRMGHRFINDFYTARFKKNPILFTIKIALKAYFPKYFQNLVNKHKIRNWI